MGMKELMLDADAVQRPYYVFLNRSPTSHFNALVIWLSVLMVVFWDALSNRVRVARLIPTFRANTSWVISPRRALKFFASSWARSMCICEHRALFTCEHCDSLPSDRTKGGGCLCSALLVARLGRNRHREGHVPHWQRRSDWLPFFEPLAS